MAKPSTPRGNPQGTPRRDVRPTLTVKGAEVGPEFRALLNRAARAAGCTQAAFVARAVSDAAQHELTGRGTPQDTPQSNPPAVVVEVAEVTARMEAQGAQLQDLTAKVDAILAAQQQPRLWARVLARFRRGRG